MRERKLLVVVCLEEVLEILRRYSNIHVSPGGSGTSHSLEDNAFGTFVSTCLDKYLNDAH